MRTFAEGRDWLARLPGIVGACAESWSLTLSEPFPYAFASMAYPVTREDGSAAVLKIQFPDRESEHEAAALDLIDGDGAVRLLAYDVGRRAAARAGRSGHAAQGPRAGLRARCVRRPPPARVEAGRSSIPAARRRSRNLGGSLPDDYERALLDAALDAIETLSGSQGEQVLVNQDMHADNVVKAAREPWLLIDPKPLSGEREFGIAATVRGRELGHSRDAVVRRLDRLAVELCLDRERARGWALAQTIAWAFDGDDADPAHVEIARWLWEAGRR